MTGRLLFLFFGMLLVATIACEPAATTPAVTPSPTPELSPGVFEQLLALVPDTPDTRSSVKLNDLAAHRQQAGLPPLSEAVEESAGEYFANHSPPVTPEEQESPTLAGWTEVPFISGWSGSGFPGRRTNLGFDYRDTEQTILVEVLPALLEVIQGRYDPEATARALSECDECVPHQVREHSGVTFYSWGEDFQGSLNLRLQPPAFDGLGRGGRIAVRDCLVFRTVETPGIHALIDTSLGQHPSLADVPEFRLLARHLDQLWRLQRLAQTGVSQCLLRGFALC
jgi:hypothetical protein